MEAVPEADVAGDLHYTQYEHALEPLYLPAIRSLISKDLSEPYSIYVYHYFLYNWPHLCFMVSSHPVLCLSKLRADPGTFSHAGR